MPRLGFIAACSAALLGAGTRPARSSTIKIAGCSRAVGRRRHRRHQLQERRRAGGQGDQRGRRHPRQEDRGHRGRHAEQPRRRQGPGAQGGRRRRVRGDRPGVLRLDHGQHGRDQARRDPQLHRRRGGRDHPAGQPLHLPHQLHAGHRDAQGGALHREQPEGQDGGGDVRQQRLRQGRPRRDHQGARSRRRSRSRPTSPPTRARSTSRRRCCKAKQSNADALFVYTNEEESARALRELRKQGYDQADRRRDHADRPEGDRAGRRRRQRRGGARRPDGRRAAVRRCEASRAKFEQEYKYKSRPQRHQGLHRRLRAQGRASRRSASSTARRWPRRCTA